jgi:hypothetical protein
MPRSNKAAQSDTAGRVTKENPPDVNRREVAMMMLSELNADGDVAAHQLGMPAVFAINFARAGSLANPF